MQGSTLPLHQESGPPAPKRAWPRRLWSRVVSDWHGTRALCSGFALLIAAALLVAADYLNHPAPDTNPDTNGYLNVARHILDNGNPIGTSRTPGYPSFIALLWLLSGSRQLEVISIGQGCLFVLAALEVYLLAWMLWKRPWIGLIVGLVIVSNIYLLGYIKPIIVEPFSLWLAVSLALAAVWYTRRVSARRLWLVAVLLLLAFLSRPEWVYFPPLLLAFLLMIAARRGCFRRLLPHALAALLVLYGLLGLYIYENSIQYGFTGITFIQNVNLLGKVLEYHMQNEAPPQYAAVAQQIDAALAHPQARSLDPYVVERYDPALGKNDWALAGSFSLAVIEAHPLEYLLKSLPAIVRLPVGFYPYSRLARNGPFGWELYQAQRLSRLLYYAEASFPLWAIGWLLLFCWRRATRLPAVEAMSAVLLIVLYQLTLDALGAYVDFRRFRTPIEPLVVLVVWGSTLWSLAWLWRRFRTRKHAAAPAEEQIASPKIESGDATP
jgi:hypothetical protein